MSWSRHNGDISAPDSLRPWRYTNLLTYLLTEEQKLLLVVTADETMVQVGPGYSIEADVDLWREELTLVPPWCKHTHTQNVIFRLNEFQAITCDNPH